jgi:hypothetical protein
MAPLAWVAHHRLLGIGLVLTTTVAVVVAGWWFFVLRSPATPFGVRQAVALYRQRQHGTGGDPLLPAAGVYRYRTTGTEALSIGVSRTFPSTTAMVVTVGVCADLVWEPFVQHVEGMTECPTADGGLRISGTSTVEAVAGVRTTSVVRCPGDAYLVPPDLGPGGRWSAACRSPGEEVALSGRYVGVTSVPVGGRPVPVVHVRVDVTYAGAVSGDSPTDYWVTWPGGVVVRQQETAELSQRSGPLGSVRYTERASLELDSLVPER